MISRPDDTERRGSESMLGGASGAAPSGGRAADEGAASSRLAAARRWLERLDAHVERLVPEWHRRGPEDPAHGLLEAFALSLADVERDAERAADRTVEALLERVGETARLASPVRGAIALVPEASLDKAVRVPARTGVTTRRSGGTPVAGAEPRPSFETVCDAWLSPARLVEAFVLDGGERRELPLRAAGSEVHRTSHYGDTSVFDRRELDRGIYLGDAAWLALRRGRGEVVLEWPGVRRELVEARWEYSVIGGWRALPVDFEESRDPVGAPVLRARVYGPLPDVAVSRLGGWRAPWIRGTVGGGASRQRLPRPRIVWAPRDLDSKVDDEEDSRPPAQTIPETATPKARRSVSRVASRVESQWDDQSFDAADELIVDGLDVDAPCVYWAWDRPLPVSLYWSAAGSSAPADHPSPRLVWEYSTDDGFRPFEPDDGTRSFGTSGTIAWGLLDGWVSRPASDVLPKRSDTDPAAPTPAPSDDEDGLRFWVRARWVGGDYFDPPRVRSVYSSAVEVVEGRTIDDAEWTLEFENGIAMVPSIHDAGIEFSSLSIAHDSAGSTTLGRRAEDGPLAGEEFRLRRSPGGALEIEVAGSIDGARRVKASGLRVGFDAALDVAPPAVVEADVEGLADVVALVVPSGPGGRETAAQLSRRVEAEWRSGFRAVTAEDFIRLARAADSLIEKATVVTDPSEPASVTVVVFPRTPCVPGRLGAPRLEAVRAFLWARALAGTVVRVVEPALVPVDVDVSIVIEPEFGDDPADVLESLRIGLAAYFDPYTGGDDGDGFPVGAAGCTEDVRLAVVRYLENRAGRTGTAVDRIRSVGDVRVSLASASGATGDFDAPLGIPVPHRIRLGSIGSHPNEASGDA